MLIQPSALQVRGGSKVLRPRHWRNATLSPASKIDGRKFPLCDRIKIENLWRICGPVRVRSVVERSPIGWGDRFLFESFSGFVVGGILLTAVCEDV